MTNKMYYLDKAEVARVAIFCDALKLKTIFGQYLESTTLAKFHIDEMSAVDGWMLHENWSEQLLILRKSEIIVVDQNSLFSQIHLFDWTLTFSNKSEKDFVVQSKPMV